MAEHETVWCLASAESGRRALTQEERRVLGVRLGQARGALKLWRLGWRVFWVLVVLAYPLCHDELARGAPKPGAVPFLYLLFATAPAAGLVALVEVATGWSRVSRGVFAVLWSGVLVGVVIGFGNTSLGPFSALGIYLAGSYVLVLRWQILRRLRGLLPLLDSDLSGGVAVEFEVTPSTGVKPPTELARAKVRFDGRSVRFAVLPRSGVLLEVDGRSIDSFRTFDRSWDPLDVAHTTSGGGYRAPLVGAPHALRDKLGQRHATPAELDEIRTHRKRLLRRGVGGFFTAAYFAAFAIRFVEAAIEKRLKTEVSPTGWAIATAIGAYFAWRSLRPRRALGYALGNARVLVVRIEDATPGAPTELEYLLGTDVMWSMDGKPAPWRRIKW